MAEEDNVRKIEVGLSFLSGADTAASERFANSLKDIANFFKTFQAGDFFKEAQKLTVFATQLQQQNQANLEMAREMQRTPGQIDMMNRLRTEGAVDLPSPDDYRQQLFDQKQKQHDDDDKKTADATAAWKSKLDESRESALGQFKIPQYGSLRITDYLREAANIAENRAMGQMKRADIVQDPETGQYSNANTGISQAGLKVDPETGEVTSALGSAAAKIQGISNISGAVYGVGNAIGAFRGKLSNAGLEPFQLQNQGATLGYGRGQTFGPFMNPLGGGGTSEGLRESLDAYKLAFSGGINLAQARAIEQASAGYGFSGGTGQNVTDNLLAPLFQKYGLNPQLVMENFGNGIRTGVQTVKGLKTELDGLAVSAKSARMTLADTANAVGQASQAVQAQGGMPQQGIAFGTQFQTGTGLPATVGGQLVQNPFIQSIIAQQTGYYPSIQGQLPAGVLNSGISQGVDTLVNMFRRQNLPDVYERDPVTGRRVLRYKGNSLQAGEAMAAHMLGTDPQTVARLYRYRNVEKQYGVLEDTLNNVSHTGLGAADINKVFQQGGLVNRNQTTGRDHPWTPAPDIKRILSVDSADQTFKIQTTSGQIENMKFSDLKNQKMLQQIENTTGGGGKPWNDFVKELQQDRYFGKGTRAEIESLNKLPEYSRKQQALKDIAKRSEHLNRTNQPGTVGTIQIQLVGKANKAFKANPTSITINANSGTGPTLSYQAATPQGISPLGAGPWDFPDIP